MKIFYQLLTVIGFMAIIACGAKEEKKVIQKEAQLAPKVKVVSTSNVNASNSFSSIGRVLSTGEAKPSFKTGGIIDKTLVKEGAFVKKGQLLATLVMTEINAQYAQAEENHKKLTRDMARIKNLYSDSVATLEQFQNITSALEIAKRSLEIARFNKNNSIITSPINGKVVKHIMRSGEIVGPGNPVYVILGVQDQDWVIKVGLVDYQWVNTNIGDETTVTFDAFPEKTFRGYIHQKASTVAGNSGTFDIDIKLNEWPKNLAAGLTTQVTFIQKKNEFTTIPIESIVKMDEKEAYVFTVENNKAKQVRVEILGFRGDQIIIDNSKIKISKVITIGAIYLEDGQEIRY